MKKVLFTIAAVALAVAANAQFVVGSNLMFSRTSNSNELNGTEVYSQDNLTSFVFNRNGNAQVVGGEPFTSTFTNLQFTPHVGYCFNDKLEAGIYFGYSTTNQKTPFNEDEYFAKYISNEFDGGLYFRYSYAQLGKFKFFAQLYAGFYTTQSKLKYNREDLGEDEITWEHATIGGINLSQNINKTFGIEAQITPGLEYAINDHFMVNLYLNFLTLGFYTSTTTYKVEDMITNELNETKLRTTDFGLRIRSTQYNPGDFTLQDILNNIGFGIRYKF
ncbi:MAG: hypothetical protein KBT04_02635 [Bacteroidales bacterium]|nr:hypothetical protein [Candidatus Colimorpha onthohippi]